MTKPLLALLLAAPLWGASPAFAQDTQCTIALSRFELGRNDRVLVVHFRLDPPDGPCTVKPLVTMDGKPYTGVVVQTGADQSDRFVTAEFQDLLSSSSIRKGAAPNELIFEIRVNNQPQILAIRLDAIAPARVARPIALGAAWFGSLEPRVSTPSLGQQQAAGIAARLGFPKIFGDLELGFEGEFSTKDAIDSELLTLASERRLLTDNFFSITAGYEAAAVSRMTIVPVGGAGFGLLKTRRLRYTISGNTVATADDQTSGAAPMFTAGADIRVRIAGRLRAVGGYRAHVLFGGDDELLNRATQHRFTFGVQFDAGGVR